MNGIEGLIREYGLWAVFFGVMIEGDLTLLFAGVLAQYGLFSFGEALLTATAGGFLSDSISYLIGHTCKQQICQSSFYQHAQPRLEKLCHRFGIYSIFVIKYIYGLRTASAIFYGFAPMKYRRFAPLTLASCALWVLLFSGVGFFFSGAIDILIGQIEQAGKILLAALLITISVAVLLYLVERYVIAPKVPEMKPEVFHPHFEHHFEKTHKPASEPESRSLRNAKGKTDSAVP